MPLRFHHCRSIASSTFGVVNSPARPQLADAPDCHAAGGCDWTEEWHEAIYFDAAYSWLADRARFWPLFLAVVETNEARRMTTYQYQHGRDAYRTAKGQPLSDALFSWRHPPPGAVYIDYVEWHIVLNSIQQTGHDPHTQHVQLHDPTDQIAIMHPTWTPDQWLHHAQHTDVQAVVPSLDLSIADEIWTPNKRAARVLHDQGFDPERTLVRRLPRSE